MNKELIIKGIGVAATLALTFAGGHQMGQTSAPAPQPVASGPIKCIITQPIPVRVEVVPLERK